jgi:hypothetical protein
MIGRGMQRVVSSAGDAKPSGRGRQALTSAASCGRSLPCPEAAAIACKRPIATA